MRRILAALALLLTACGPITAGIPGTDSGAQDGAALDAPGDTAQLETGAFEAATPDAPADGTTMSPDAGPDAVVDASPDAALPTCVAGGAACVNVGCRFAPAILRSCDPGEAELPVYGADFCERRATLVVIVAGWCPPCMAEAPEIERSITQGYAARGVRVVTVVAQKPDRSTADASFCNVWRTNYTLTSTMAFDPRMETSRYFPGMTLPASVLVDRRGVIRWRSGSASAGLAATREAIDAVLATP